MATSEDFINYICEQIKGVGEIRYRKNQKIKKRRRLVIPIKLKGSEKETVHELYHKLLDVSNQKDKKGYITHIKSINAWCLNNICINGHSFTFPEIIKADYDTLCEIAQKYGKGMPEMSDQDKKFMIEYLYNQRFSVIRKEFSDKLEMKVCPYCNTWILGFT